jgi:putative FmdB family regulatory protein
VSTATTTTRGTPYVYACPEHGELELRRPMGAAPPQTTCPVCGGAARRVWAVASQCSPPRGDDVQSAITRYQLRHLK